MSIQRYSFTAQRRLEIHKEDEGDYVRFSDHLAELHNLLSTLADIRRESGVGDGPMLSELAGEIRKLKRERDEAVESLQELVDVATLRGDNDLPHPADDAILWTARMQEAWNDAEEVVSKINGVQR